MCLWEWFSLLCRVRDILCRLFKPCGLLGFVWTDYWGNKSNHVITSLGWIVHESYEISPKWGKVSNDNDEVCINSVNKYSLFLQQNQWWTILRYMCEFDFIIHLRWLAKVVFCFWFSLPWIGCEYCKFQLC